MTLDDIEKRAADQLQNVAEYDWESQGVYAQIYWLATAVMAMAPVVRAAERIERGCECEYDYRCGRCQRVVDLHEAIDHLRSRLGVE